MNTNLAPGYTTTSENAYVSGNTDPVSAAEHGKNTQTPSGHSSDGNHVIQDIKDTLHDIKQNVKETLQGDHHKGQDCPKRPQDGKTNPME
ncbi:hypothetical protein G6F56_005855 [Rhizopus delemar]|uniref:Uncharacterized protein n=1 Tax=Rhizopus stolonifer TaxID=4846 RepID=A0A367J159_RHIST|nr:hypothetical protein G6F56_005855 [Rhizopus delemar]RCH83674.1 hypothetical protein CU098_009121 [Rhizopus stolonifer]